MEKNLEENTPTCDFTEQEKRMMQLSLQKVEISAYYKANAHSLGRRRFRLF